MPRHENATPVNYYLTFIPLQLYYSKLKMRSFGLEISGNARPTKGQRRELTTAERAAIIYARKPGVPRKQLALDFACSASTTNRTLSRFNTHNTLCSLPRSGRPSKLN
jgi:hypothetical protein